MTRAPISFFANFRSLRMSFSRIGTTKARVFPEPVTASTTTSLCRMKSGIVDAWTGVIRVCPMEWITSKLSRVHACSKLSASRYIHPWRERCRQCLPFSCECCGRSHVLQRCCVWNRLGAQNDRAGRKSGGRKTRMSRVTRRGTGVTVTVERMSQVGSKDSALPSSPGTASCTGSAILRPSDRPLIPTSAGPQPSSSPACLVPLQSSAVSSFSRPLAACLVLMANSLYVKPPRR